jgi:hypothetical protein
MIQHQRKGTILAAGLHNLVKFIIQLHKVAYNYVTLFDVYECALNPELLESRIQEAERLVVGERFVVDQDAAFRAHPEFESFGFVPAQPPGLYKAPDSKPLMEALRKAGVEHKSQPVFPLGPVDPLKQEILEGVKRWFYNDCRRIENKLRTSIVEGISVFLKANLPRLRPVHEDCPVRDLSFQEYLDVRSPQKTSPKHTEPRSSI